MAILEISQNIYYSNKEYVTVGEIANSLIALENIIKETPSVLEALFPDSSIMDVKVFVKELKSDSIFEDILVRFLFGDQKRLNEFIDNARERLGIKKAMENPKILSAVIAAMMLAGISYYLGKDVSSADAKNTIEANNNVVIQIGASELDMTADDFIRLVETAMGNKDKIAENASQFISPAKRDKRATITFQDDKDLVITSESIAATPTPEEIAESKPNELTQELSNVELQIRAIDLDSLKTGWGAVIPAVSEKRIKLNIDPTVDISKLVPNTTMRADITLVLKRNGDIVTPKLAFLRNIITNDKANTAK